MSAMLKSRSAFSSMPLGSRRPSPAIAGRSSRRSTVAVQAAKGAAMVCIDCGYIYDGKTDFDSLPAGYKCPVCSSSKKRFKAFKGNAPKGGDVKSMQARKMKLREQIEESGEEVEEDNGFLYVTAGSTFVFLAAFAYFTLNR